MLACQHSIWLRRVPQMPAWEWPWSLDAACASHYGDHGAGLQPNQCLATMVGCTCHSNKSEPLDPHCGEGEFSVKHKKHVENLFKQKSYVKLLDKNHFLWLNDLLGPLNFTVVNLKRRPVITSSVLYDVGSCPLTLGIAFLHACNSGTSSIFISE